MGSEKTKWFEMPASGFGYASKFYLRVFHSLKQDEALNLEASLPPMKTSWFLDEGCYESWFKLLNYNSPVPQTFTFSAPAGVWALMQILEDLGISFGRIMHMSSRMQMLNEEGFRANQHYTNFVHYLGARPHGKKAVLIRFQSVIRDITGREVMNLEDELYVSGLNAEFVKQLSLTHEPHERRLSKSALLNNPMADRIPLAIARSMGHKYGKLSGDLNPLHISSIGARLFGHKKSFVQGMCTLNIILAQLGLHWKGSIRSIEMHFIRPVPQPAKLALLCTLDQFEILDSENNLLVAGNYICG